MTVVIGIVKVEIELWGINPTNAAVLVDEVPELLKVGLADGAWLAGTRRLSRPRVTDGISSISL